MVAASSVHPSMLSLLAVIQLCKTWRVIGNRPFSRQYTFYFTVRADSFPLISHYFLLPTTREYSNRNNTRRHLILKRFHCHTFQNQVGVFDCKVSSVARARLQQCPLHEAQYGFRPHRSALFPIVGMKLLVQQARRAGRTLYAVFVDIKEAFYSLDRQKLFVLLEKAGVGPALFHVLAANI